MPHSDTMTLLGGLSSQQFLKRYWQKKSHLIRNAIPDFGSLLTPAELMELACREDCRSRLILRDGRKWNVTHGPFDPRTLRRLPARGWALLVQDINLVSREAHELLMRFAFVPYARMDDLMVSLAPDGAGVGPHFDSYDVFLLQGLGSRRWELSEQTDLTLVEGAPLRLLKHFRKETAHVLESGDMLYLPPSVAHNGVALGTCMTYSVGFRSPGWREVTSAFLSYLDDHLNLQGRYEDPGLLPSDAPAQVPEQMVNATMARIAKLDMSSRNVLNFLGAYLTEPQSHVVFDPPAQPLTRARFATAVGRNGVTLDLRTRMLWVDGSVFVNAESAKVGGIVEKPLRQLANARRLLPGLSLRPQVLDLLYQWYRAGYLLIDEAQPARPNDLNLAQHP